jgi:small subunit ribosomal protein S20
MANKSALKRLRTSEKARIRHKARTSEIKTTEKNLRSAVDSADLDQSQKLLTQAASNLDRAVKAGTIHKNKANRKKSQLAKLVDTIKK